jgi:hypothetical protein
MENSAKKNTKVEHSDAETFSPTEQDEYNDVEGLLSITKFHELKEIEKFLEDE